MVDEQNDSVQSISIIPIFKTFIIRNLNFFYLKKNPFWISLDAKQLRCFHASIFITFPRYLPNGY